MKKLFYATLLAGAMTAHGNLVNWQYRGTAADANAAVYLYVASEAPTTFASVDALKDDANSIITGKTLNDSGKQTGSAEYNWSAGNSFYVVLVSSDGKSFYIDSTKTTIAAGNIYNEGETAGSTASVRTGSTTHTYAAFTGGGQGGGDVPEPTSGLLLLVGGALLGLRRKRA